MLFLAKGVFWFPEGWQEYFLVMTRLREGFLVEGFFWFLEGWETWNLPMRGLRTKHTLRGLKMHFSSWGPARVFFGLRRGGKVVFFVQCPSSPSYYTTIIEMGGEVVSILFVQDCRSFTEIFSSFLVIYFNLYFHLAMHSVCFSTRSFLISIFLKFQL